jgi:hypothetical protein
MDNRKTLLQRIQGIIDNARRVNFLYLLLPAGWKAYIVTVCLAAALAIVGWLRHVSLPWIIVGSLLIAAITLIAWTALERKPYKSKSHSTEGWFALEAPQQVHNYIPVEVFITNVGPRSVRHLRFDPIISRHKWKLWFHNVPSLAIGQRIRLGISVGDTGSQLATAGNIANFFEGGTTPDTDPPPYPLTIRFLDGTEEQVERHAVEGYPLDKGGISFKITPATHLEENKTSAHSLEKRTKNLAEELFALLREQGTEPLNPLRFKGNLEDQRRVFNTYFEWKKKTFFKYMAHFRDRVVKIDYELAAAGIMTGLEYKELDPPPNSQEVDVKRIAEALLLTAAHNSPDSTSAAS